MKTVFKTLVNEKLAQEKRDKFQRETGAKWDYYHTGKGMVFTPVITRQTNSSPYFGLKLLPALSVKEKGFVALSEQVDSSLIDVLSGAKFLIQVGYALGEVNRMGNISAIRRKRVSE